MACTGPASCHRFCWPASCRMRWPGCCINCRRRLLGPGDDAGPAVIAGAFAALFLRAAAAAAPSTCGGSVSQTWPSSASTSSTRGYSVSMSTPAHRATGPVRRPLAPPETGDLVRRLARLPSWKLRGEVAGRLTGKALGDPGGRRRFLLGPGVRGQPAASRQDKPHAVSLTLQSHIRRWARGNAACSCCTGGPGCTARGRRQEVSQER